MIRTASDPRTWEPEMLQAFQDMQKGYWFNLYSPAEVEIKKQEAWNAKTQKAITTFWEYWNAVRAAEKNG